MKPLTIEELRNLEVEDWVWVVVIDKDFDFEMVTGYYQKISEFNFKDYGTKWLAYKNKEYAEVKGDIVELPCKIGDKAWRVYDLGAMSSIEEVYVTDIIIDDRYIDIGFSQTGSRLTLKRSGERISTQNVYLDKSEAECRLKELKGEE